MTFNKTIRNKPARGGHAPGPIPAPAGEPDGEDAAARASRPDAAANGAAAATGQDRSPGGDGATAATGERAAAGDDTASGDEPGQAAPSGLTGRLRGAVDVVYREMVKFGAIGALAYVVDTYVYNVMRSGWWPLTDAPLGHKPLMSKVISTAVATVVAWLGNRYWTFRHRRRAAMRSEFALFIVMNVGGLLIALGCLYFSHYVLGLTGAVADNVSGNIIGLALGTLFRFWAYRQFVFTEFKQSAPDPAES